MILGRLVVLKRSDYNMLLQEPVTQLFQPQDIGVHALELTDVLVKLSHDDTLGFIACVNIVPKYEVIRCNVIKNPGALLRIHLN